MSEYYMYKHLDPLFLDNFDRKDRLICNPLPNNWGIFNVFKNAIRQQSRSTQDRYDYMYGYQQRKFKLQL